MSARSGQAAVLDHRPEAAPEELERALLARLGLSVNANAQDVEAAHDQLTAFLETAPHELRGWARRQIAIADESYALLSDPTTFTAGTFAGPLDDTAPPPHLAQPNALAPSHSTLTQGNPATGSGRAASSIAARISAGRGPVRRILIAAAAVVALVTVVFAVYTSGAPTVPGVTGTPVPEASDQAGVDTAQVAELMQKIQADPKDVGSLQALGDLYFSSGDYATAAEWETKVLALEPRNLTALLGLGAANFNQGNVADAEKHWRTALEIDPYNLEAHYDLGFMYFSQNPPDIEQTRAEWNSVIEIAPDSDIAKTVAAHLETLESWAASASPAGSPAASPTGSTGSSPAPSAGNSPAASTVAP